MGEQLGNEAFAGAEIGDVDGGREAEREVADGFPGAAGAVVFAEAAGDEVEILFLGAPAFLEDAIEVGAVLGDDGEVGHGLDGGAEEREGFGRNAGAEGVEGFFALAAVGDEVDLPEECELGGDAGLAHAEDFLEFGHGEFLACHEGEEAQAGGVGECFEDVPGSVHAGKKLRWFGIACKQALQQAGELPDAKGGEDEPGHDVQGAKSAGAETGAKRGGGEAEQEPPRGRAEKHAGDESDGGECGGAGGADAEARENAEEREDREWVGEREREGGKIGGGKIRGGGGAGDDRGRARAERGEAEVDEKEAAAELEECAVFEQEGRDGGKAEGGDDAVEGVGRGGAETGHETGKAAVGEGTADTEQADGSDGGGDGETDDEALEEGRHGETR